MERSAGILIYRRKDTGEVEVLLGKCGGPQWDKRFRGAWNIPKGHVEHDETDISTALREFKEETSLEVRIPRSVDEFLDLGTAKTASGKTVHIFAIEYDFNKDGYEVPISANLVDTEWPKNSGRTIKVPELSKAYYFTINKAKEIIFPYQRIFLERLADDLSKMKG